MTPIDWNAYTVAMNLVLDDEKDNDHMGLRRKVKSLVSKAPILATLLALYLRAMHEVKRLQLLKVTDESWVKKYLKASSAYYRIQGSLASMIAACEEDFGGDNLESGGFERVSSFIRRLSDRRLYDKKYLEKNLIPLLKGEVKIEGVRKFSVKGELDKRLTKKKFSKRRGK